MCSHNGVEGGWPELIANQSVMPYIRHIYDRADGPQGSDDVDVDYAAHVNYAKDGTTMADISDDSVLSRVKRHISLSDDVDIVAILCPTNDLGEDKGTIEDGYTTFATDTVLGALQECIRYITVDAQKRCGFIIPYLICYSGVYDDGHYYDDYVSIFNKWGVPFLDLRSHNPGFNLRSCIAHIDLYTIAPKPYDNEKVYPLDSKVSYNGSSYKNHVANISGILPTNSDYWTLVSTRAHDGVHLNSLGHKILYRKIMSFIESL